MTVRDAGLWNARGAGLGDGRDMAAPEGGAEQRGSVAAGRLAVFRECLARRGIDVFVVTDSDPHASEYVAEHWKARSWLSGFTGSSGTLVVTAAEAALWTDGRYYIQAGRQLEGSSIELMRAGEPGTPEYTAWIARRAAAAADLKGGAGEAVVGINGCVTACAAYDALVKALGAAHARVEIEYDIIAEIWLEGRPPMPRDPIFIHELRYAGRSVSEKLADVRAELKSRGATHAVVCGLEDVAWLMNIRGGDIPRLPVAYAFALVSADTAELFADSAKVPSEVARALSAEGVTVADPSELEPRLASIEGLRLTYDPDKLNRLLLGRAHPSAVLLSSDEPTLALKGVKNGTEIRRHRECQAWDGAAMARFLMWAGRAARERAGTLTEWAAVAARRQFRSELPENRGDSFSTIAGFGPNGAMMHYAPTEAASSVIGENGLMVVDSGGQYPGGTTDVTRTVVFGTPTPEERRDFTLTLKSHIALASARFLYGAAGAHIDSIARKVMWDDGLDYKCGTGHGIGCYLSVHEGPQSISMRVANTVRLEENMIVSIEPGVYREGKHGVRIENLALIREDFTNEFGRFMRFEILSFCPIDLAGVDAGLLDDKERRWLNDYHARVYEKLSPLLTSDEREWLAAATRGI